MPSPIPDIKKDERVLKLRSENKLSFREIGKITGEDVKTVFRRYKRAVGKLSTVAVV